MRCTRRFSRREVVGLAALVVTGTATWGLRQGLLPRAEYPADSLVPVPDAENVRRLRSLGQHLRPLFTALPTPRSQDWLAQHAEPGQTFMEFARSYPPPSGQRPQEVRVVPLGRMTSLGEQLLEETCTYLGIFFGLPVHRHDTVSLVDLPASVQRVRGSGVRQLRTRYFLDSVLREFCDCETAVVFGLTAEDLWDGDFSFLFGQGAAATRTCIGSTARFGDIAAGEVSYATCLRRTIGLATHEIGHVFHLSHCIAFSCRMNGSNHLAESDRRPLEFCPECLPKIWWTCPVEPSSRFEQLEDFATAHDLNEDAGLWRAAAQRLTVHPSGRI